MIEVEVFGANTRACAPDAWAGAAKGELRSAGSDVTFAEVRRLCALAAAAAGVQDGHLAIEFVDAKRITQLNGEYRKQPTPTDVLSFPVDGVEPIAAGRSRELGDPAIELGDVVICAEHTVELREAIVHGVLHLVGMDHETDDGEMLALQRELLAGEGR